MLDRDLENVLSSSIRSVWALEVLLLLRRHAPHAVTPETLTRELRATHSLVRTCLKQLEAAGLVGPDDAGWRFLPSSPRLAEICERLAQVYVERPVAVVDAIMSSPDARLKNFSDAFRFKDKEEGE